MALDRARRSGRRRRRPALGRGPGAGSGTGIAGGAWARPAHTGIGTGRGQGAQGPVLLAPGLCPAAAGQRIAGPGAAIYAGPETPGRWPGLGTLGAGADTPAGTAGWMNEPSPMEARTGMETMWKKTLSVARWLLPHVRRAAPVTLVLGLLALIVATCGWAPAGRWVVTIRWPAGRCGRWSPWWRY